MPYTHKLLEQHLGKKYNPKATYLIETHKGAASRVIEGTHKIVGEISDFAPNETGTMIIMVKQDTKTEPIATESIEEKVVVPAPIWGAKATTKPGTTITPKPSGGPKR
jgi:hypothetical protein